ncbi:hypothetical protein [Actinospica robiniae]|uniref:hypothetical protein n=1 Tax=Actinospica robiniae TaxID=304901 RepID=UPI0003FAE4EC|nr:hypothetical protein [Actinospica robiniae]
MVDLPGYVSALVLLVALGIPLMTSVLLYRGGRVAGMSGRAAGTMAASCGVVWGGWVAASARLADLGSYRPHPPNPSPVPWFPVAFAGAMGVALAATRIPPVARALSAPGTAARLTVPHTLRIAGGVFLIVAALHELPPLFALPAGLGDIAIGLEAPFLARRLARGEGRRSAVWFNLLGLFDFVVAVTIAFLAGIGPHQYLLVTPSTRALALLPLALIPTTAVPLVSALHIVTLRRLAGEAADAGIYGVRLSPLRPTRT